MRNNAYFSTPNDRPKDFEDKAEVFFDQKIYRAQYSSVIWIYIRRNHSAPNFPFTKLGLSFFENVKMNAFFIVHCQYI